MSGPIGTGNHPKAFLLGVDVMWGLKYASHPAVYSRIFEQKNSGMNFEELVQNTPFGYAGKVDEGGTLLTASTQQGYVTRAVHVEWGLRCEVTFIEMEDGKYPQLHADRIAGLAFSANQTKELVHALILDRADNGSYIYGDLQPLISESHPDGKGGLWSTKLATGSTLDSEALQDLSIMATKATNDAGLQIALMFKTLVVPADLRFEAAKILYTMGQAGTANRDINVLQHENVFSGGIIHHPYLKDTNNFFCLTNVPRAGLVTYQRRKPTFSTDNVSQTRNADFSFTERYSVTCGDPRAIFASTPA